MREPSVVAVLHEQSHTPVYKTMNWLACNEAIKRRGSLTIWFDPAMTLGGGADRQAGPTA